METNLPEYIEGIPTEKKRVKERFQLICDYYNNLWKELQKNKTSHEAVHNWKSTYAVKHLDTVIKYAMPYEGLPMFSSVKDGLQKKNGYKNMILLYYSFTNETFDYLNFTAKLTIGVTVGKKHIQYSVNKVEIK